jgi:hypothetical protein
MFPPTSRYAGIPIAKWIDPARREVAYLRRRFVPQPESIVAPIEHAVVQGDRLDNVTARYLRDPEQFWRLCDANRAMIPDDLVRMPGRRLRIPIPIGA